MIVAERATHPARGWTLEHDLTHQPGSLTQAAVAFAAGHPLALPPGWQDGETEGACSPSLDPSPEARARRLVIAGSLIAAELDCMIARGEIT